ncbi:PadR family transcriptional regulator [Streptomyces sp. NPDC088358]|uniref:PadR family transcriptional regulator n=1 Tax=Streptomyces sp. NPDC088358 TaxID=3365857 RepID=UPI00382207B9
MTLQTQLVLRALLENPAKQRYGLELCDLAGPPSGTIYPILARLEQIGWLDSSWEDPAVHEETGRPRDASTGSPKTVPNRRASRSPAPTAPASSLCQDGRPPGLQAMGSAMKARRRLRVGA